MFSEHIEPEPHLPPAHVEVARARQFQENSLQKFVRMARAIWHSGENLPFSTTLHVLDAVLRDKTVGAREALDPRHALTEPDGFCALLNDVSAVSLMDVYERGAFIDSGVASASCWAPAQRLVIDVNNPRLLKAGQNSRWQCDLDSDFESVLTACNSARNVSNSPKLLHAYCSMFDTGIAHCASLRDAQGNQVAGLFGVAVGRVLVVQGEFYADESQRSTLYLALLSQLRHRGYLFADLTPVRAADFEFVEAMSRENFSALVTGNLAQGCVGRWISPAVQQIFASAA